MFEIIISIVVLSSVAVCEVQVTTTTEANLTTNQPELQTEVNTYQPTTQNTTHVPNNHSDTDKAANLEASIKEMHRIVQPTNLQSQSQTQQINHKIAPILNITAKTDLSKVRNFRPSPQLETYYEFNRHPVKPALSEAKIFGSVEKVPWIEKQPIHNIYAKNIYDNYKNTYDTNKNLDDTWTTKVRFPNSYPITVKDHPYPYEKDIDQSPSGNFYGKHNPKISTGLALKHNTYETIPEHNPQPENHHGSKYSWFGDSWDKTGLKLHKKPSKTLFEGDSHSHVNTDLSSSPWKKIIKILTAFIPIGLLISALTPSVITIHPMNNMTYRARLEDGRSQKHYGLNLLSELQENGCDQRILCEILLSAEQNKNTENVDTFLESYTQGIGSPEKLEKIYDAVKKSDCTALYCEKMDKKPS